MLSNIYKQKVYNITVEEIMSLIVEQVRIRNFRSLKEVNVKLEPLTLLVGTNNSGKTSFLKALELVFGIDHKQIRKEDFYTDASTQLNSAQESNIDVLLIPVNQEGERVRTFNEAWSNYWGEALIRTDDNDFEHIPIRTIIGFNTSKRDFIIQRHVLSNWEENPNDWRQSFLLGEIPLEKMEKIPLLYLDAQRDIQKEMKNPLSFWGKLIADIDLDKEKIESIETDLMHLNKLILESSSILSHLQKNLNYLNNVSFDEHKGVEITPVTRKVRDIQRGIDVLFSEFGTESFPLEYHGMGTRSWATLLTFRSYASWIEKVSKEEQMPFWCILALEEPESHLHPQAQRKILKQMTAFEGQKIISSHSPYIASLAPLNSIRHFSKNRAETIVSYVNMSKLSKEEIRKINREVMNTRGELLFSKTIILCEGETEEQALPIFFEAYFGFTPFELGVNIVGVGGKGKKYLPFLHVAEGLKINWLIFSDGEHDVLNELESALSLIDSSFTDSRVIYLENHENFEEYILANYPAEAKESIIDCDAKNEIHRMALSKMELSNEDILRKLKSGKTKYATMIAEKITNSSDEEERVPEKIKQLFKQIKV